MATSAKIDKWGYERVGYEDHQVVAYAPARPQPAKAGFDWICAERRLALTLFGAAVLWGVHVMEPDFSNLSVLWSTPGPLELSGIAALVRIHARWRLGYRRG